MPRAPERVPPRHPNRAVSAPLNASRPAGRPCVEAGDLVLVEVKARRSASHGTPAEAVVGRKQRVLAHLAAAYLARRALDERPCRFDVVEVWLDREDRPVRVDILRDAFRP